MSLVVSSFIIDKTKSDLFARDRLSTGNRDYERQVVVNESRVGRAGLEELLEITREEGDAKSVKAIEAILAAMSGLFDKAVPNFKAFKGVLESFLKKDMIDGWIYVRGKDGLLYPRLVKSVVYEEANSRHSRDHDSVTINTDSMSLDDKRIKLKRDSFRFVGGDASRRKIGNILLEKGIFKETQGLKDEYLEQMAHYEKSVANGFSKLYRFTGKALMSEEGYGRNVVVGNMNRVIHDLPLSSVGAIDSNSDSDLFGEDFEGVVPFHPIIRVFDTKSHEFFWVNSAMLEPHVYDKTLSSKLVMPASHRDLLDVLTSDTSAFTADFIEGKSAGNVILCKGQPGVGKTLTAECMSEIIECPLYSIHSGTLGTSASEIEKSLKVIFERAKRWNAVLLLDECDVFVAQRGNNVEQNAIVAEFLRAMEYFDGLLFMTTNRPDDIDDAFISRCAAIIHYDLPTPENAGLIWNVLANQFGTTLPEGLVADLVKVFPQIAPRDIKMLLRLALRVAKSEGKEVDIELFRRCSMFRNVKFVPLE